MTLNHRTPAMLTAAALLCLPLAAIAQEATPDRGPRLTGHVAYRWTRLYEDAAGLAGGGIGVMLAGGSRIELAGFGTASPSTYGSLEFHVAYGGIRVERDLWRSGRFMTSAALFAGGGRFWTRERQTDVEERTGIGVIEPALLSGVDLGAEVRLAVTGSYRWVTGVEGDILNRSDGDARGLAFGVHVAVR